jgi:spore maturation protein CgeB
VDNPFYKDRDVLMRSLNGDCVIFVWDKAYVEAMRALGFKNVFYLRLGVNPKVFRKMELKEDDIGKYGADIGFVGISAYSTLYGFSGYKKYLELIQHPKVEPILNETIERICQDPSIDPKRVLVEVSLSKKVGIRCDKESLFYMTLDYAATSIIRRRVVEAICDFGCSVWGDKGWVEMLSDKIRYCGWADRNTILPKIYNATKINLNVTMAQLRTALPWRVFEVTACGGFLLTDIREDIWSSFDVGKEVIGYRDLRELKEKVEYYLRHQDEREEIARHGMMRTLKDHTYMRRMEEVLEVMSSLYG